MILDDKKIKEIEKFKRKFTRKNVSADYEKLAGLYPRGFLSIVASPAGSGKTWLMQYVACGLSVGGVILGGLTVSDPRKVLILTGETGADLLNRRLVQTSWFYDGDMISVYSAIDMGIENFPYLLDTKEGRENIMTIISNEKPDIVFFDTLISFHGLDESRQGEMTKIYLFLCQMAKLFNCAVVCNHHTRKRPADNPTRQQNQDDVIGTSAGVRLAASVYVVSQTTDETGQHEEIMTVRNVKSWDKKIKPFSYRFVTTSEGLIDFEVTLDVGTGRDRVVENYIGTLEHGALVKIADVAKACDVTESVARYHLKHDNRVKEVYYLGQKFWKIVD